MFVPTEQLQKKVLENTQANVSSGSFHGILSGCKIGIGTGSLTPTSKTVYADIVPATWSGYAEQTATFDTPFRREDGALAVESAQLSFGISSGTTGGTGNYAYLTDGGVTPVLLGVERFDSAVTLVDALDRIYATMQVAPFGGTDFGTGEYTS